ncbi:MAG: SEC-C metal-binding domain-containing protein, partial [Candidatus Eremiobacteraeota bacterium]|nr:SEC-C metal-binding domain-containing protein [Candidatus Eremiobacteraeota bacterium]
YTMDSLKQGIGLRGWGQKDPRVEYEKEAFELFEDLKVAIQEEFLAAMFQGEDFHIVVQAPDGAPAQAPSPNGAPALPGQDAVHAPQSSLPVPDARTARRFEQLHSNRDESAGGPAPVRNADKKVGRNDPCPCGSGRKFKKCHGATAA